MPAREDWKKYQAAIKDLAYKTIRSWMVGVEVKDIENELWTEFFRLCDTGDIARWSMMEQLEAFAHRYKKEERDHKFGKDSSPLSKIEELQSGRFQKHWKEVRTMWEEFIRRLPKLDAMILRYAAQGVTNRTIAEALKIGARTVERRKPELIRAFIKEVENNVQVDFTERNTKFNEGI